MATSSARCSTYGGGLPEQTRKTEDRSLVFRLHAWYPFLEIVWAVHSGNSLEWRIALPQLPEDRSQLSRFVALQRPTMLQVMKLPAEEFHLLRLDAARREETDNNLCRETKRPPGKSVGSPRF